MAVSERGISILFLCLFLAAALLFGEHNYLRRISWTTSDPSFVRPLLTKTRASQQQQDVGGATSGTQSLYIIRHAERLDLDLKAKRVPKDQWPDDCCWPHDSVLSEEGIRHARDAGVFLNELFAKDGVRSANQVTILSSTFVRMVQTANNIIDTLNVTNADSIPVYLERCLAKSKADYEETVARLLHLPRVSTSLQNRLGIPNDKETGFSNRVKDTMKALNQHFPYQPQTAVIVVTHGVVSPLLIEYASGFPAKGRKGKHTSITRLTRSSNSEMWQIDKNVLFSGEHITK